MALKLAPRWSTGRATRDGNGAPMNERERFDKFTERARKILSLAQEEAYRLNHDYIGTEHLLGLILESRDPKPGAVYCVSACSRSPNSAGCWR
jgi:hypothetical protein